MNKSNIITKQIKVGLFNFKSNDNDLEKRLCASQNLFALDNNMCYLFMTIK